MKQKQKDKPPLSPKEYKEELRSVDLSKIELDSCSAKLRRDRLQAIPGPITLDVTNKAEHKIIDPKMAVLTEQFLLVGTRTTKRDYIIRIECTLSVTLTKTKGEFTREFLDTYMIVNLDLNTWPYFREFVHNITHRMDIPPLVLPFLKER